MINYISGILSEIHENMIVVEAAGIGYGINVPASLLDKLPRTGSALKIYTYFSVKEDSQSLYGFLNREDREMFKSLLGVNGVGPKGALAILSVMAPDELRMSIAAGDAKSISRAQGIGIKTAERVILELKSKIGEIGLVQLKYGDGNISHVNAADSPVNEAMDALITLGYSRTEALKALNGINIAEDMTTEEIIKSALKNIRI